jgi:hypothetical protein
MRTETRGRLRLPAPSMVVALIALVIALGGTAVAATGTVVNIADGHTATRLATVDVSGALKTVGSVTSGFVGPMAPKYPFFGKIFLSSAGTNPAITANKSVVALTRIVIDNYYGQTANAAIQVSLFELGGNATTCDGTSGSRPIGIYDVQAGTSFSDSMQSPIVLQPLQPNTVWCLNAFVSVQGSPGSYFLPALSISGYTSSGPPPNVVSNKAPPGAPPPMASSRN